MFEHTTYTKEKLENIVKNTNSFVDMCKALKLNVSGSNYKTLRKKIEEANIDISHWRRDKKTRGKQRPLDELLVKDSDYIYTNALKLRLIRSGLLEYQCYTCGIQSWQGKELTLQIDHINGDNRDNRLENLRLLCPNCHSQTPTHSGKAFGPKRKNLRNAVKVNKKKYKKKTKSCLDCNVQIYPSAKRCKSCAGKLRERNKISWPETNDLIKMVQATSYTAVGKQLGVSDNAVRKRILKTI